MSLHSEQGEEKSEGFCLDEELKSLDARDLYNLVQNLIRKNSGVHRLVLEWFKEKAEVSSVAEEVVTLNDELLMEYWEKAENIISEFNEYCGGPEDEEEEAFRLSGSALIAEHPSIAKAGSNGRQEYRRDVENFTTGNFNITFSIPQSHWIDKILPGLGYGKVKLIEIPALEQKF